MDDYLIPFDFRQKIEDARKNQWLISPEEYIADIQQLLDLIQGIAEPYEERILVLETNVADLENSNERYWDTGDYEEGNRSGFLSGHKTGLEEGMRRARRQMREALGM